MSRFLVSRKVTEEDDRTEHSNNMPLNLEKPINLEMRRADSRRHSITNRDSGIVLFYVSCLNSEASTPWKCSNLA